MSNRHIIESIQAISGTRLTDKIYIAKANVESYDEAAMTAIVTLIDGENESEIIIDLVADVDDGVLILPSQGSTVTVIWSKFIQPTMCFFPSTFDKIIFLGGQNGGLPLSPNIVTRLNNIENAFNNFVEKYNAHTHPGVIVGTDVTAPTASQETDTLTTTIQDDIQSTTILQ